MVGFLGLVRVAESGPKIPSLKSKGDSLRRMTPNIDFQPPCIPINTHTHRNYTQISMGNFVPMIHVNKCCPIIKVSVRE